MVKDMIRKDANNKIKDTIGDKEQHETEPSELTLTKNFTQTTAIHGIGHVSQANRIHGAIWAVICLSSFGA